MRPLLKLASIFCALGFVPVNVAAAEWTGSYATGSGCYCAGTLSSQLAHRMAPTPIGGQSIAQICGRVGSGPTLNKVDGRFNYPVYKDAQCGNGPFPAGTKPVDDSCAGTVEPGTDDCQAIGPLWDLQAAYSDESNVARASASVAANNNSVKRATTKTSRYVDAQSIAKKPISEVPAAVENVARARSGVAQRTVIIDGKTFREAPAGTPESGGLPGSRIVLDGLVFVAVVDGEQIESPVETAPITRQPIAKVLPKKSEEINRVRQEKLIADARKRLKLQESEAKQRSVPTAATVVRSDAAADTEQVEKVEVVETAKGVQKETVAKKLDVTENEVTQVASRKQRKQSNIPEKLVETDRQNALEEAATTVASDSGKTSESVFVNALRMPPATRTSSRDFSYLDAMPVSYDFGGAGMWLEGSAVGGSGVRYLARAGLANDYQEVMLGASWFMTPAKADRLTLVGTVAAEAGHFDFEAPDISTDYESMGMYLGIASRAVINDRFELRVGLGYSSFFEGDFTLDGGAFYHINRQLDVVSRFEIGDNDSLGIGVRYYY